MTARNSPNQTDKQQSSCRWKGKHFSHVLNSNIYTSIDKNTIKSQISHMARNKNKCLCSKEKKNTETDIWRGKK